MILNRQRRIRVALPPLEKFFARVRCALDLPAESVTVCLLTDAKIARLNQAFRRRRGPTDVLSFPADGHFKRKSGRRAARSASYLGDIAISPETARRHARRFGRRLDEELQVLLLHGVLHLLGYDHETDRGEMERYEAQLRRRLGVC
jgi:probable rRNA maturation factor